MHLTAYFSTILQNIIHMFFFDYFKTSNPVVNTIFTTFSFILVSYIVRTLQDYDFQEMRFSLVSIKYLLFKKNMVILEGKKSTYSSGYDKHIFFSSLYTDRFNAMWNYIIKNISKNKSIYEIKELPSPNGDPYNESKNKDINDYQKDLFIVTQDREFLIDEKLKIYATTKIYTEDQENKEIKEKTATKIDRITIRLFSYETDVSKIKYFIDDITEKYLKNIEDERFNKKFIYTLTKTTYEEQRHECWSECIFESSKTFDNLFFKGKSDIIYKLNFFINNKSWYYKMGIPYTIGIGLHGPPGTGKTSLIKCVANMLNRHVINLSLKLIKTRRQLDDFFFEDRYNVANKKSSIGFADKIIVIEDIDCIGDLVLKRSNFKKKMSKTGDIDLNSLTTRSNVNVGDVLKTIVDQKNEEDLLKVCKLQNNEEPITLDDILNLWDGLRETPGRVLIISSNCYGDLDPALIRPGRIDVTLELGNATHKIISELYTHLTGLLIPEKTLKKIKSNFYSQAEIINMFLTSNKVPKVFIERMLLNKK